MNEAQSEEALNLMRQLRDSLQDLGVGCVVMAGVENEHGVLIMSTFDNDTVSSMLKQLLAHMSGEDADLDEMQEGLAPGQLLN